MLTLYHSPVTRSVRVRWLLEELGLPYELRSVEFAPPGKAFFTQQTPLGKIPVIEDGEVTICESGAIVEYILERYGEGRLAPPVGSPLRGPFLQWLHFAEATAFQPLGIIVWMTRYKDRKDVEGIEPLIENTKERAHAGFAFLEKALAGKDYVLGGDFSAADIMLGFTLVAGRLLGVLDDRYPNLGAYLDRLQERPALQKARQP